MSDELEGGDFTVVEGRDGFLFLSTYEQTDVTRLFTDPSALPDSVRDEWSRTLARRREYFEQRGTTYLTLVVPDSHLVYADKLPQPTELTPDTPYRQVEARLDDATRAQCLYLLDDLVAARAEHDTFQTTDSHWSDFGAYVAYRRTMAAIAPRVPNIEVLPPERLEWTERLSFGALGAVMPQERSERIRVARVLDSGCRVIRMISTEVRDGYLLVEQDRPDLPTAVVFRDSFMTNAHKFFSESFRRVVYVSHPNQLYFDLIEAEDPDVVIFETVERRLGIPPREPTPHDFRMVFGDLLLGNDEAVRAQVTSRTLLRAGDLTGALAAHDEALALVTPTARLMLYRSRLFTLLERPDEALEAVQAATRIDPLDGPIAHALARSLHHHGLAVEAAAAARRAARLEGRHVAYWAFAISMTLGAGEVDVARTLAIDALEEHRDNPVLSYLASQMHVAAGDLTAAEAEVRAALTASPDDPVYLRQLASVLIRAEQWPAARDCLVRLQRLDPGSTDVDAFITLVDHRMATTSI